MMTTALHAPIKMEGRLVQIEDALAQQMNGTAIPFLIRDIGTGRAAGSTRYSNIDITLRRLEIGWTWIGEDWQHSAIDAETKLLLLAYAFERMGALAST